MLEYGAAKFILPGQKESGNQHLICWGKTGLLVAAIDGLRHGQEAGNATKTAESILRKDAGEPVASGRVSTGSRGQGSEELSKRNGRRARPGRALYGDSRMRAAIKHKRKPGDSIEETYGNALLEHLHNPSEATLGSAYELGRSAIAEGKSLIEFVSLHHRALEKIFSSTTNAHLQKEILDSGASFLAESLSPFEMTHRGFQDAVKALRHLNETLEEEIKRIAYAVHDEAGQLLVAVHLALAELNSNLLDQQKQKLAHVQELLKQVEEQLRRYSHELRPSILDDLGWMPALRFLADGVNKRSGLSVEVETTVKGRLPGPHETVLYRVVQEALTNATKHSKAKSVRISIQHKGPMLCCSVHDDGVGFDEQSLRSGNRRTGLGLVAMRERLNAIGGTLSIESALGRGTKIVIQIPRETRNARSNRPGR
jgi:signal transduction histidine kinase